MGFSLRSLFGLKTVTPSWSFTGKVTVPGSASSTAVPQVLCDGYWIEIKEGHASIQVYDAAKKPTATWTIEGKVSGDMVLYGRAGSPDFHFVMCVGLQELHEPHLAGIIYGTDLGDGQDPGTWEADEAGGPEEPPRA